MKKFFHKIIPVFLSVLIVGFALVSPISCFAKEETEYTQSEPLEFKVTAPKVIAAGLAVVVFTCAQVIIYLKTDRGDKNGRK